MESRAPAGVCLFLKVGCGLLTEIRDSGSLVVIISFERIEPKVGKRDAYKET